MPPKNKQELLSRGQAVAQILAQVDGPLPLEELDQRILAIRPSKAKNPRASLHDHLRWHEAGKTLVFLDNQTIVPLRIAMRGVRFRIPLSHQEVKIGVLLVEPGFTHFLRQGLSPQAVHFSDPEGQALPVNVVTVQQRVRSPFGDYTQDLAAFELGAWFRSRKARKDDSILVTIEDWEAGRFCLEHEPAGAARMRSPGRIRSWPTPSLLCWKRLGMSASLRIWPSPPPMPACLTRAATPGITG